MSDLADMLIEDAKSYKHGGKSEVKKNRKQRLLDKSINANKKVTIKYKNIAGLAKKFKEFVGYTNYKGDITEGTAFPPPIDEKGNYLGILDHEIEGFKLCWKYIKKGILFKWPRGYGKTYLATWFMEFTMYYFGFPWLYLSSTEILSDVAFWVYKWANKENLIIASTKGGRKNTYTSFELNTGGKMRIYDYLGEAMVGQHGWYLMLDDVTKKKWEDRPADGLRAKRQWLYSISLIKKIGLVIFGTRKYQGDLLEFLEKILIPKGLHVEVHTPYIMDGDFPNWAAIVDPMTQRERLWVPELYTWEELEDKKVTIDDPDIDPYLSFQAEMMQNPMPRVGGLADEDDIKYLQSYPPRHSIRQIGIGVDIAWTEGEQSDDSGIVTCIMYSEEVMRPGFTRKKLEKRFCFIRADIGRMPIRNRYGKDKNLERYGLLENIQKHYDFVKRVFPQVGIIVAIERNTGGVVIIDQAMRNANIFSFANSIIEDSSPAYRRRKSKGPSEVKRLGITHSKEKNARIFGELSYPTKNGIIKFHRSLNGNELIDQFVTFPRSRYDDGVDAAGMIKDELSKNWSSISNEKIKEIMADRMKKEKLDRFRKKWMIKNVTPWDATIGRGGRS